MSNSSVCNVHLHSPNAIGSFSHHRCTNLTECTFETCFHVEWSPIIYHNFETSTLRVVRKHLILLIWYHMDLFDWIPLVLKVFILLFFEAVKQGLIISPPVVNHVTVTIIYDV